MTLNPELNTVDMAFWWNLSNAELSNFVTALLVIPEMAAEHLLGGDLSHVDLAHNRIQLNFHLFSGLSNSHMRYLATRLAPTTRSPTS